MKKSLLLLFVICFFFSCSSEKKKQAPTVLLSETEMVDVITDVQIMEAAIGYKKNVNQPTEYLKTIGYDTIFSHYGITDSIFKANMVYYYDAEPLTLIRIYDSVEAHLARMKN
jgi:hypothetical protein